MAVRSQEGRGAKGVAGRQARGCKGGWGAEYMKGYVNPQLVQLQGF